MPTRYHFHTRDPYSDRGTANVVIIADTRRDAWKLLNTHLKERERTELLFEIVKISDSDHVMYSDVEQASPSLREIHEQDFARQWMSMGDKLVDNPPTEIIMTEEQFKNFNWSKVRPSGELISRKPHTMTEAEAQKLYDNISRQLSELPQGNPCAEIELPSDTIPQDGRSLLAAKYAMPGETYEALIARIKTKSLQAEDDKRLFNAQYEIIKEAEVLGKLDSKTLRELAQSMGLASDSADQNAARLEEIRAELGELRRAVKMVAIKPRQPPVDMMHSVSAGIHPTFTEHYMSERRAWRAGYHPEPAGRGGYINNFNCRVPNPCREIDMKGRDMDKIYRWLRPDDKMDEATLDHLNAVEETPGMLAAAADQAYLKWCQSIEALISQSQLTDQSGDNSDGKPSQPRDAGSGQDSGEEAQ